MRTLLLSLAPVACALAACGPSDSEVAEAERSKSVRTDAAVAGLAEPPLDLGDGLILTVLQRGSGAFVPAGGRVRVHYDASVIAVGEEPTDEPTPQPTDGELPAGEPLTQEAAADAQAPAEGGAPVGGDAAAGEGATEPTEEAASGTETTSAPTPAAQEQEPGAAAGVAAEAAAADPAAPPTEGAALPAAEAADAALPRRFDSSRARGVPDTWDLSRTASPRLIEGLRNGSVPPRADVLYEIELLEVLP